MNKRILALAMVLCVMMTTLPVNALAEDYIEPELERVEVEVPEISKEIGISDQDAEASPAAREAAYEAADGVLTDDLPMAVEEVWSGRGGGYARVSTPVNMVYDDGFVIVAENVPQDTLVRILEISDAGSAKIAWVAGGEDLEPAGWMDVQDLAPLTEDEAEALKSASTEVVVESKLEDQAVQSDDVLEVSEEADEAQAASMAAEDAQVKAAAAEPDAVKFNVKTLTIGIGEVSDALKVVLGSDESKTYATSLTYSSSKPSIATVDQDGVLKGIKTGKTVVTVKTGNGLKATCTVSVKKKPTKVTVTPKTLTLGVGQTQALAYKLTPSKAGGSLQWSSNNKSVATVDPKTGEVTAIGTGTAKITVKTYNNKKAVSTVTVKAAPTALSFEDASVTLGVGQKISIQAKVEPDAGGDIQYQSKKPKIVAVEGNTLTAVAKGTATIVATTYNGLQATCKVVVKAAPKSVKLPYKTLYLGLKETSQLEPTAGGCTLGFTYSSNKTKYVKVSASGLVTAVKVGSATVTVKSYNGKSFKLKVVVYKAPTSLSISPSRMELGVGETETLACKLSSGSCANVQLMSSDPSVAEVDSDTGVITATGSGTATITATTYNGLKDSCTVVVLSEPTYIELNVEALELSVGDSAQLIPSFDGGTRAQVTYESDDASVAEVSPDGVVTGKAAGSTIIRALTGVPEVYAEVDVAVVSAPSSVKLPAVGVKMDVGEVYALEPIIPSGSSTTFTYRSSSPSVAEVDEAGVVHAVGKGTATVTVSTHNGKTASLKVTVSDPFYPESIVLKGSVPTLSVGDSFTVSYSVLPAGAETELNWSSSNSSVATVDGEGEVTAVGRGSATITAVSVKNSSCKLTLTVKVSGSSNLTLEIPERITTIKEIDANLAKIDAIRRSTIQVIDELEDDRAITSSDASKRRSMVNNIFACYSFPWMTLRYQDYWKAANSEGGVKDFKPGNVYYGLPYTSGSGDQRHYNVAQALSENRYYDSGKGYYIMNQNNLLKGKYVGNDCSGLVDVAIWGTNSSHSDDRTSEIAKSSAYRTISDFRSMRPGDLICKSSSHVVMFLYYVDESKDSIMMIENGGAEAGTNTVHCDIYDWSYYSSRGYKVRRLSTLG